MDILAKITTDVVHSDTGVETVHLINLGASTIQTTFLKIEPLIVVLILTVTLVPLLVITCVLLLKWTLLKKTLKQKSILLEAKPLRETLQGSYSTQQLFTLLNGLAKQKSFWNRFVNANRQYGFEIVATKEEGIRYLIRVTEDDLELVQKGLLSYLPGIRVTEVPEYLQDNSDHEQITTITQSNHFAFPLKQLQNLEEYDPIAYLTGNMTKLEKDELLVFQVVVSPLNKKLAPDLKRISKLLYTNRDLLPNIGHSSGQLPLQIFRLIIQVLAFPLGIAVFFLSEGNQSPFLPLPMGNVKEKTLNPYQAELELQVKQKLDQQLFHTSVRFLIRTPQASSFKQKRKGVLSALAAFNNAGYQSLVSASSLPFGLGRKFQSRLFRARALPLFHPLILSISEVADLYHFPFTTTTKTEDLVKSLSKELPAPLSLKGKRKLDIVFAKNSYGGTQTMIGLDQDERRRHMYILGATGTGKSTLLLSMIVQDMEHGKGRCDRPTWRFD